MADLIKGLPPELATGGGLLVLVLYALWRRLRQDLSADRRDGAEDKFRADLLAQNNLLLDRCDRFASERNAARERAAVLEAENARLAAEAADLRRQLAAVQPVVAAAAAAGG